MIRSLLKRTKFHRAALMLLAMLLTTPVWAEALPETKDNVEYIGENGELKTANNVTVLDADDGRDPTIGESYTETWYYVNDKEIFNTINIEGTVNIILGDNADLIVDYIYGEAKTTLNIYGTGRLTTEYLESGIINIYGGTISATRTDKPGILGDNGVSIYGGKITATSISTYNDNDIRLGWILPDDYINVSNYDGNVTILPGKEFYYNNTEKVSSDDNISINDIKGKKLQPVVASISIDGSNETIYSCLTEKESVFNRSDHDVNIKLLTDANFYGSQIIFDNNNSETEGETTQNTKITLNLNGHTLTGKFTKMEGGYLNVYPVILVEKKANVEITDLSEGKGGTFNVIYCISNDGTLSVSNVSFFLKDKEGTSILNYGTLSVSNVSFISKNEGKAFIKNYGSLSVSNTKFDCKNADANNVTQGIYTDENSTLNIGSGVSFSNFKYGIYTYYDNGEPFMARAMTRGSEIKKEPAKLYINALPVFKNCMYDIYLNLSIMDFSNATAPLTLASGQERITFTYETNVPGIVCTKGYKHAFTDPETGTITNPNDIFNYKAYEGDGSLYYIDDESYCYIPGSGLSSVITNASGAITYRGEFDNSNTGISFKNTLNNLENCSTVQLLSDITGTEAFVINKGTAEAPVTLDLNGHTITGDLTVESGCKLMLIDSSNGKGHIKGAISVPVDALQNCLTNWSDKADVIKSTGYCGKESENGGKDITWTFTKTDGDKIGDNFPLKLTIDGSGEMSDFYGSATNYPWDITRSNITEVVMSDGITTIGTAAFQGCSNLASIKISSDVESIRANAFNRCKSLTDITIPAKVASIGDQAFVYCETLKTIHMKGSTVPTLVPSYANYRFNFNGCNAIQYILTPSGEAMNNYATADGWSAYADKLGIEGYCGDASVDGGKNVTWMMTQNGTVTVDIYKQENDNLVKIDEAQVAAFNLTISGTGAIANYADTNDAPWMAVSSQQADASQPATFYTDKKFITALEIGAGVTDLGTNAYNDLRVLKSLTIADGSPLTTIAFDDFRDCDLTTITLPDAVAHIDLNNDPNNLFYAINNKAWRQYRSLFTDVKGTCGKTSGDNLTWALTAGSEPDTNGRYPLTLTISGTGAMADYDNQNQRAPWGTFASVLSLPEGLTHIGEYAFSNNSLTTVAIPASVETIGGHAFEYCGLSSVTFAENCKLTTLGSGVFYHCHSLSSIVIPASIVTLGSAFRNCSSLASVTFAENSALTTISETFRECTTLETIDIPATVTEIGFSSFNGCSALKTVRLNRYDTSDTEHPLITLGKSVNNEYCQFANCPLLRGILVPEGAQSAYQQDATWQEAGYTSMIYDAKKTLYTANTTNQWMTWCSDIEYFKPKNCTVYTVSGVNSEQVQVAEVEGDVIPAYTPVLIKRAEGTLESDLKVDFSDAKKPSKENGWNISSTWYTLCDNNGITPTYGYNSISYNNDNGVLQADAKYNNNYSIFFYGNTGTVKDANTTGNIDQYEANYVLYGDKLMLVDTDNGIPVNRCVLKVSYKPGGAVCSRSLTIGVGGDTTGMEELKNEKIEELNSEWYDLQGRKLGSKPTRKGLYINNGKKIVIK